jgi:hypothetical protein
MLDRFLSDVGLTRKDLRYNFTWRGRRYYVPAFNPLWWIISIVSVVGAAVLSYIFVLSLILITS